MTLNIIFSVVGTRGSYQDYCRSQGAKDMHAQIQSKGRLTPWTMTLDHGRWPFLMAQLRGPTSMV